MTFSAPRTLDDLPFRPCVGIMLLNAQGQVFVGSRIDAEVKTAELGEDYVWQMPQGGIDAGEEPYAAALRELYEETNVQSVTLLGESANWYTYDLPGVTPEKPWKGKWRGQKQKWFVFRFDGHESEIDIATPAQGQHSAEFDGWRWVDMHKLPSMIVFFKRPVYEGLVQEFAHLGTPAV